MKELFIDLLDLPISIPMSPFFEYYIDLYEKDYNSRSMWESFQKEVKDKDKWISFYKNLKERIIQNILENSSYQKFIQEPFDHFKSPEEQKNSLYSGNNINKKFISIDLKEANFQALHWYNPKITLSEETWEDFLKKYGVQDDSIIFRSKNLRQRILGKLNSGRQILIERYLIWKISELVSLLIPNRVFSRATDEIIFEEGEKKISEEEIEETIKKSLGLRVKVSTFKLLRIQKFTSSGKSILSYAKKFENGEMKIKGTQKIYFPQMYKFWNNLEVNPYYDLAFLQDGEISHFDYPLK